MLKTRGNNISFAVFFGVIFFAVCLIIIKGPVKDIFIWWERMVHSATVTKCGPFSSGQILTAAHVNCIDTAVLNDYNGNIQKVNMDTGAGFVYTGDANIFTANQRINAGLGVNSAPPATGNITISGALNAAGVITTSAIVAGGPITTDGLTSTAVIQTSGAVNIASGNDITAVGQLRVSSGADHTVTTACAVGYTRVGLWCMDTDGSLVTLRTTTSNDGAYVLATVDASAKLAIILVRSVSDQDGTAETLTVKSCTQPGDSSNTSCTTVNGQAVASTASTTVQERNEDIAQITVQTDSAGRVETRCLITVTSADTTSCEWYIAGYMD